MSSFVVKWDILNNFKIIRAQEIVPYFFFYCGILISSRVLVCTDILCSLSLRIIMDLLKMNVAPQAILQVLRSISGQRPKKISSPEVSQRPNPGDERRGKPRSRVPSNKKPEARRWPQAHSDNKSTEQTYSNTRQCRERVYITLLRKGG